MASNEKVTLTSVINRQLELLDQKINLVKWECGECIKQVECELAAYGQEGIVIGRGWAEERKSRKRRIDNLKEKSIKGSGEDRDLDRQINSESLRYRSDVSEKRIENFTNWHYWNYGWIKNCCLSISKKSDGLLEVIQNAIAEVSRKIDEIEEEWIAPSVGFFAVKRSPLPAGDVTEFECKDNYGRHLDPSSGRFTAPLSGFYLISVSTSSQGTASSKICLHRTKHQSEQNPTALCDVHANRSITLRVHMNVGDAIRLESETDVQTPEILIQFSCCLLQCGTAYQPLTVNKYFEGIESGLALFLSMLKAERGVSGNL